MWVPLLLLLVGIVIFIIFVQRSGGFNFPWVQFYVKGKESGFKFKELNLLRRVAVDNKLKNPTSLFWSEKTLDRCIRGTVLKFRSEDREDSAESQDFLSKLYDFRKTVEFNLPKYRIGIKSSRAITAGQILKLTFQSSSVYVSKVVENMRRYMAISYPKGKSLPPGFSWEGQRINVYFWRAEDAGYYFETKVIGDYLDRQFPILHVAHSDGLTRTQKRNSVRADISDSANLFPLRSIKDANEGIERSGGFRAKMVDISEDGAAVKVGGKVKPGVPVKLQLHLNHEPVVICGTVKGVSYKKKSNISVLHLQAVPPSKAMRNRILSFVYGIFRESDGNEPKKASAPTS